MYGASPIEILATQAMIDRKVYCWGFTYSALWFGTNALGASATVPVTTQISSTEDFVIQRLNLVSFTALDTPEVNPDFTLELTIAGTAINLFDAAQSIENVAGNFFDNRVPNDLPFPILVQANNNLVAKLVNRTVQAQNFTQLSYIGFKVKYLGNTTRNEVFHVL